MLVSTMFQNHQIQVLLENDRRWVTEVTRDDPDFFVRTVSQQAPKYLWIGYSDNRVTRNQMEL
jgi:carbonic anhydrase